MAKTIDRPHLLALHPAHAALLAGTFPLFLAAMLSDVAYASTYQIQWSNFASWLIAGGLVIGALVVLWAVIDVVRADSRGGHVRIYTLLVLATWLLGFWNALVHAKDAWASMPMGLILSIVVTVLACAATWIGFSSLRVGGAR